jgi:hypothetical protein
MPTNLINKISKELNISITDAESAWDKAKNIVDKEYNYSKDNEKYWKLVVSITKKILNLKESSNDLDNFIVDKLVDDIKEYESDIDFDETWALNDNINENFNYHTLRVFLTMIMYRSSNSATKNIIKDLINIIAPLERYKVPTPIVPKFSNTSKTF